MPKRPIPKVNMKEYAEQGVVEIKPTPEHNAVALSLHYCTVFLSEKEALQICLSLMQACFKMWGNTFVRRYLTHMESL